MFCDSVPVVRKSPRKFVDAIVPRLRDGPSPPTLDGSKGDEHGPGEDEYKNMAAILKKEYPAYTPTESHSSTGHVLLLKAPVKANETSEFQQLANVYDIHLRYENASGKGAVFLSGQCVKIKQSNPESAASDDEMIFFVLITQVPRRRYWLALAYTGGD